MADREPRRTASRAGALALAAVAALAVALTATVPASAVAPSSDRAAPTAVIGGDRVPVVKDLGPTSFTKRGPYRVGERTLELRTNGAPVEVWYPAKFADAVGKRPASYDVVDWLPEFMQSLLPAGATVSYPSGGVRGVDVARGRFPLVVFSHGYAGFRDQSSFLTSWLASWGFIVAAPDHHSRDLTTVLGGAAGDTTDVGDLRATVTLMKDKAANRRSIFHRHVDLGRVGAVGHSAGGAAVEAWAVNDTRVKTFVGMAGATVGAFGEAEHGPRSTVPKKPGLLMAATSDGVVDSADMVSAYKALRKPKRLVLLGGGHHAFSDLCEVGESEGGLLEVAALLGVTVPPQLALLASDGCEPPALPPTEAWPAVRQATVAHLRHVFRFDRSDKGLRGLVTAFPGVVSENRSAR